MVYSKKEYLAWEYLAPTVVVTNIAGQFTTITMHQHKELELLGCAPTLNPTYWILSKYLATL
ncbi:MULTISPECIES: hypothetical protein [unclassified Okeania]|uniref:hypothetical protein n=1 Tax=unclassified Okeania TaxID=2634635 RepID=UPI0013C0E88D|nr:MULTISPECIES: hypothetical protein [unclassified Okeania]NEP73732.1 hypothetical protein [Okeania sp. SIO2G5]NEQ92250.1 hypothetical protein [Okeania sp. SIO2G4]NET14401.1 hypothetical protein [Okeania sp. SIO1H6]NET94907.1 hypothetical protein [Okeania sp. SIO1H2]NEP73733.1 hypothetical protein [Okeania sp. SIO2G5]